jgi:hypothetical protein
VTSIRQGQVIESWETRIEVVEVSDTKAKVKVLDCWDKYMKGGDPTGCMGSYLDIGKTYTLNRHPGWSNMEVWVFRESELKRRDSQILLEVIDGKASLDMDT